MMDRPTILLIIPNLNFGGAQRVFYNISIELSREYKVIECVFNMDSGHAFKTGNEVISLDVQGGNNLIAKAIQFFKRVKRLRELKNSLKPVISISHLEGADLVNVLSRVNDKTITWVHGSKKFDQNIDGLIGIIRHRMLIPWVYSKTDLVVTVSKAIKQELVSIYRVDGMRIKPMHNFFDRKDIIEQSNQALSGELDSIFKNHQVIIFSGRLVTQKNPLMMLSWFASFLRIHPCKLVIIGDGELRESMIQLCNQLSLKIYEGSHQMLNDEYDVFFLGFRKNPFNIIRKGAVFILPSLWEGFPMVIGEAMCCEIPVVAADCPTGPREMLINEELEDQNIELPFFSEYGVLMPLLLEKNFETWNRAMKSLLDNPKRLLGYRIKSLERSVSYSKESNAEAVLKLINGVLK